MKTDETIDVYQLLEDEEDKRKFPYVDTKDKTTIVAENHRCILFSWAVK